MTPPQINTPRGKIIILSNGKASLEFNANFSQKWTEQYSLAQRFVDSEVLRLSEPFIPLDTSMLIKSGILGTDVGSGTVQWIAPYARAQYYGTRAPGSQTGPLRGPQWFERMKALYGPQIVAGAKKIAGGG